MADIRDLQRDMEAMRAHTAELEAEIQRLREAAQRAVQLVRQGRCPTGDAKEALKAACQQYLAVAAKPHIFFAPGQMAILQQNLNRCGEWLQQGMTDAALALACDTHAELRMLEQRIAAARDAYLALLEEYEKQIITLARELSAALTPFETALGTFERDTACLDYYSSGLYNQSAREVIAAETELLRPIRDQGDAAFQSGRLPAAHELSRRLRELPSLQARVDAAVIAADREMLHSDARKQAGKALSCLLCDMGYAVLQADFEAQQPLNPFVVEGLLDASVNLRVIFTPQREDGIACGNTATVFCDARFGGERENQALLEAWRQRIQPLTGDMMIYDGKRPEDGKFSFSSMQPAQPELYVRRAVQAATAY